MESKFCLSLVSLSILTSYIIILTSYIIFWLYISMSYIIHVHHFANCLCFLRYEGRRGNELSIQIRHKILPNPPMHHWIHKAFGRVSNLVPFIPNPLKLLIRYFHHLRRSVTLIFEQIEMAIHSSYCSFSHVFGDHFLTRWIVNLSRGEYWWVLP